MTPVRLSAQETSSHAAAKKEFRIRAHWDAMRQRAHWDAMRRRAHWDAMRRRAREIMRVRHDTFVLRRRETLMRLAVLRETMSHEASALSGLHERLSRAVAQVRLHETAHGTL
jgi:hypothetical protein